MDMTSNAVGAIQAAIIEDLADPKGLQMKAPGLRVSPRCHLHAELQGVAFMRSFHGDPDQRAWESCVDPMAMMEALARVGEEPPIRLLSNGLTRFIDQTRKLLLGRADDEVCRHRLNTLEQHLKVSGSYRRVAETCVWARAAIDADAAAILAHQLWLAIPVAPHRFSGVVVPDEELVRRLGVLVKRLNTAEQIWLDEASYRVLRSGGSLTPSERERVDAVLRARGPWHVFVKGW